VSSERCSCWNVANRDLEKHHPSLLSASISTTISHTSIVELRVSDGSKEV
jgi:hypothetical protein